MNYQLRQSQRGSTVAQPIYLDHQATTPVDPRVADVVLSAMTERFGNPNSSDHCLGDDAAHLITDAAVELAGLVGAASDDVRFTGSATEALRLVIGFETKAARGPIAVAASRIEHPAVIDVLEAAAKEGLLSVKWINCDHEGLVPLDSVGQALEGGMDLLFLMAANNEVGSIQPITEAARLAAAAKVSLVVDASQAAGRVPIDVESCGIDYLVLSSHKLYGPKGVGALIGSRLAAMPSPFALEAHAPTPNTPAIAGFGEACRLRRIEMLVDEARIKGLRDRLEAGLRRRLPDMVLNGPRVARLAGNLNISIPDAPNDQVMAQLRDRIAISTGAACASGADAPSHVLMAMGLPAWRQETALRIGVGKFNTTDEIDLAVEAIASAVRVVRGH